MPVCDVYRLQALVDGELPELEAAALTAHVKSCAACGRLLATLRLVSEPLHNPVESVPDGLEERLLAAVAGLQPLPALSCEKALELVSARLDGELSHSECQQLAAHLDGCAACDGAAAQTELTDGLLRSIAPEAAPSGLLQRIEAATELASTPAPRPVQWRRWVPSFAGVAAAAALLVALLSNSPQAPTTAPMAAHAPAVERAAQAAIPEAPVRPVAPKVAFNAPARAVSTPAATRLASAGQLPKPTLAAPKTLSTQRLASATASHVARTVVLPATLAVPASPAVAPELEIHQPMAVAVAPTRVTQPDASREVGLVAMPHADAPPALAAHPLETPRAVRVANMDEPKATPAVTQSRKPSEKRQHAWVSRPDNDEREVYKSEDPGTRLADARDRLDRDIRHIVDSEVKGFVIH
jgi:anti-sigma factor RsiW